MRTKHKSDETHVEIQCQGMVRGDFEVKYILFSKSSANTVIPRGTITLKIRKNVAVQLYNALGKELND